MLRALSMAAVLGIAWIALAGLPESPAEAGAAAAALMAAGVLGARFSAGAPSRTSISGKLLALAWALRAGLRALVRTPRLCAATLSPARSGEFVRVVVNAPSDLGRAVAAGGLTLSGAGALVDVDGAGVLLHVTGPRQVTGRDQDAARRAGSAIAGLRS